MSIGESLRNLNDERPVHHRAERAIAANQARVQFAQPQANEVFSAIAHDVTVPKVSVTPTATPSPAQVLTTNPGNVKVKILNGSGVAGIAAQAAVGLTSRGPT